MRASVTGGGDFELPPEGYQKARCIRAIDLGTQESKYKDQVSLKRQLLLMFEIPGVRVEWEGEDRAALISKKYNLTFSNKATLRKDMESWYGKKFNDKDIEAAGGFDPAKVVGRPAKIQITHSDDGKYANIGVIIPEDDCPPQEHPSVIIDLDDLDLEAWNGLSEKMQVWIGQSPEYKEIVEKQSPKQEEANLSGGAVADDDIPFAPIDHRCA